VRLLRPGGQLIFLVNSVLLMLTVPDDDGRPATERMLRPYFDMLQFITGRSAPIRQNILATP
jgi:hypothetical protein